MTTVMAKVADIAKRLTSARTAVAELGDHERALRTAHAELHQERVRLIASTPPREELIRTLDAHVQALREQWVRAHGGRVVAALGGAVELTARGDVTGTRTGGLVEFGGVVDLPTLAALAPVLVRDALAAIIEGTRYDEGPPLADRPKLIAEIDTRIAAIEADHAALVDEAARAGVALQHMPGESGRRIQAQQRRSLAQRHNEANRDAIARGVLAPMPEE